MTLAVGVLAAAPASATSPDCTATPGPGVDLSGCLLESDSYAGVDFTSANLSGAAFAGDDMTGVNLTGADLSGANLNNTTLTNAKFTGADLTGAHLSAAAIGNADFTNATLSGISTGDLTGTPSAVPSGWRVLGGYFVGAGATLTNANLPGADLSGLTLTGTDLAYANLLGANLTNTDFTDASLSSADVRGATVTGADFTGAALTGLQSGTLVGTPAALPASWVTTHGFIVGPGANLSYANLTGQDWSDTNLSSVNFFQANLTNVNLGGTNLASTDLSYATIAGVSSGGVTGTPKFPLTSHWLLRGGYLVGPGANLSSAALTGLDLTGASLHGATLTGASLDGATLTSASSGGVVGTPASLPASWHLTGGYLVGPRASLGSADLSGLDLSGDDLSDATLGNANLAGANLTATNLSGQTFDLTGVRSGGIIGTPSVLPPSWTVRNGYLVGPGADLTGASLAGMDLSGLPLDHAIFTNANAAGAILTNASLTYATLLNTNLTGADLTNATLAGANLKGAKLNGANVYGVVWSLTTCPDGRVVTGTACPTTAPKASAVPTLRVSGGVVRADLAMSCSAPAFSPSGTVGYAWLVGGSVVAHATAAVFTPPGTSVGRTVQCRVSSTNYVGAGYAYSVKRTISAGVKLRAVSRPHISGSRHIGKTLTCSRGTWTPSATKYRYQWYRSGHAIKGATGSKHRAVKADRGTKLQCRVTVSRVGHPSASYKTSPYTVFK